MTGVSLPERAAVLAAAEGHCSQCGGGPFAGGPFSHCSDHRDPAILHDPDCEDCHGSGECFTHTLDCEDDLCALNGDEHSCVGQVLKCACVAPCPLHGHHDFRPHDDYAHGPDIPSGTVFECRHCPAEIRGAAARALLAGLEAEAFEEPAV